MAFYRKEVFVLNKKHEFKKISESIEKVSCEPKFWKKSGNEERAFNSTCHTYLSFGTDSHGKRYVYQAISFFGDKEKVVRTLITTKNYLSKRFLRN